MYSGCAFVGDASYWEMCVCVLCFFMFLPFWLPTLDGFVEIHNFVTVNVVLVRLASVRTNLLMCRFLYGSLKWLRVQQAYLWPLVTLVLQNIMAIKTGMLRKMLSSDIAKTLVGCWGFLLNFAGCLQPMHLSPLQPLQALASTAGTYWFRKPWVCFSG